MLRIYIVGIFFVEIRVTRFYYFLILADMQIGINDRDIHFYGDRDIYDKEYCDPYFYFCYDRNMYISDICYISDIYEKDIVRDPYS
mgnify:CR=1 FL=1